MIFGDPVWFELIAYIVFLVMTVFLRKSKESIRIIISGFCALIGILLGFALLTEILELAVILILFNFALLVWAFVSEPEGGKKK
jgi:hypothetical protein